MIKMRVLNSYKQIKFSGVGIGGKKNVFTKHKNAALKANQAEQAMQTTFKSIQSNGKNAFGLDADTRRDSIFPSELDGEDQQTQTMFEPFQTTQDGFNMISINQSTKYKGIPIQQKTFEFDKDDPEAKLKQRPVGIENILNSHKVRKPSQLNKTF